MDKKCGKGKEYNDHYNKLELEGIYLKSEIIGKGKEYFDNTINDNPLSYIIVLK